MIIIDKETALEFTKPIFIDSSCWKCRYSTLEDIMGLLNTVMNNGGIFYSNRNIECRVFKNFIQFDVINCEHFECFTIYASQILYVNFGLILKLGIEI